MGPEVDPAEEQHVHLFAMWEGADSESMRQEIQKTRLHED